MNLFAWLAGCWLATAAVCAAIGQTEITAMRSWAALAEGDSAVRAFEVLQTQPAAALTRGEAPTFRVGTDRPTWILLDVAPLPMPAVLELAHPAIDRVELFRPGAGTRPLEEAGRQMPAEARQDHRFPATLHLPKSAEPQRLLLRVQAGVPVHGQVLLQPRQPWETASRLQLALMTLGFGIAGLATVYALARAAALRSVAYLLYALLAANIACAGLLLTGLGEATVWPWLAPWRNQAASTLGCVGAALSLLLAERAFALEISAPRFALAMRWMAGIGLAAAAAVPLLAPAPAQTLAHVAIGLSMVLGIRAFRLARRTANVVASWLLIGYLPVFICVGAITLGIAGLLPFAPWMLLTLPLAGVLEAPFNLHGLRLLEERRAQVRANLRALHVEADGESREELKRRLDLPPDRAARRDAGCALLLLRFEGLAPGARTRRDLDSVATEHYLQAMMAAALRPGTDVGRWSHHELVVRDLQHRDDAGLQGLVTALFAQSLRGERFGIPRQDPALRIAVVRVHAQEVPVGMLVRRMGKALDDAPKARRVDIEPWED